MSKTKYPNQIDTPSELPIVRDNIFEIGSDAINSLRSAIIQIEKTLGVNPQGAVGLSVGDRLSQSLDPSGNIKTEALDIAGVMYGPVFDDNVSSVAAIKESKLKLDFPTKILQSEISYVSSLIDEIQLQIEGISASLSAHLSPDAINRHKAIAISTSAIETTTSSSGIKSLAATNVQDALSKVFSSHINYDGSLISDTNNSHSANQIYFDKSTTSNIDSDDVQGAIEDISSLATLGVYEHQDLFHSNGFARSSYIHDKTLADYGVLLSESSVASVFANLGEKPYFEMTIDTPLPIPAEGIGIGDIVELTVAGIAKEYQIYQIQYDGTVENILGFWLFGTFKSNQVEIDTKIFLKRYRSYNSIGILSTNREKNGLSSSDIIQITNPDAPFLISSGLNAAEITSSNRYFDLKINGASYSFDVYVSTITTQSIDSIIKAINETVDTLSLPILAYRKNIESGGIEIVIAHNISSEDSVESSLEIVRSDGAIDSLGLSGFESKVIYGQPGSSYYISGNKYNGLLKKLDTTQLFAAQSASTISSGASEIDFLSAGIKKGDIISIIDTNVNSYEITDVSSTILTVSSRQIPSGFASSSTSTAKFIIYESSILANSLEFLNIDAGAGASLLELFLDKNRALNLNLILEQEAQSYVGKSLYSVLDFYSTASVASVDVNFENTIDSCVEVWLDGSTARTKIVGNLNYIQLKSNIKNFTCSIYVPDKTALYNYASGIGGSFVSKIYPTEAVNLENNLIISYAHYCNFLGKFDGGIDGAIFTSKLNFGNLDKKDLSTSFKHEIIERPISELRSSGVIFGLEVNGTSGADGYSSATYLVSISDGICYVNGKRFEILGGTLIDSGIDVITYDKLYVGVNYYGEIVFSAPDPSCTYPWADDDIMLLATIEISSGSAYIIDQRLFIDNIDLKVLNSITVSQQPGMGHFSSLSKAIKYAKRFSEIYTKAGTPEIHLKSGKYTITQDVTTTSSLSAWQTNIYSSGANSDKVLFYNALIQMGLAIDFPVSISGEGDGTELELILNLTTSDYTNHEGSAYLAVLGSGFNPTGTEATLLHGRFDSGSISFKNFKISKGSILFADINNYDGSIASNFFISINQLNIEVDLIRFVEASDISSYKGNVIISNSKLYGGILQLPSTTPVAGRLRNVNISNNILPGVATTGPLVGANTTFPAENNIIYMGNISGVDADTDARKDRVAYDLFVPNDLTVAGDIFVGTRTYEKTYWAYQSQIIYEAGATDNDFTAADPFIYELGLTKSIRSAYRIAQTQVGAFTPAYVLPSVLLSDSTQLYHSLSIPIEILNNQKLKSIRIMGSTNSSTSNTINVSLISMNNFGGSINSPNVIMSPTSYTKLGFYYDIPYVYKPASALSHILIIKNTLTTASQKIDRVILTFEADNIFELLGIN
jgi:hypothetical protein